MTDSIRLTIDWRNANSEAPERQQEALTQSVYRELRSHPAFQKVHRVPDPDIPEGAMGAQWLWHILTAEIPGSGLREACREALDKLEGKPMTLKLEVNDKSIVVKDVEHQNFEQVVDKLVEAIKDMEKT